MHPHNDKLIGIRFEIIVSKKEMIASANQRHPNPHMISANGILAVCNADAANLANSGSSTDVNGTKPRSLAISVRFRANFSIAYAD